MSAEGTAPTGVGGDVGRLMRAVGFASDMHASQVRKGTMVPYIVHPLRVAALVAAYGGTEDQIIAALLHDVAEDQGGRDSLADIESRFGPQVAQIVHRCSDALPEAGQAKAPWRPRKRSYLTELESAGDGPESLVELGDKVANLEDLLRDLEASGEATLDRFRGGRSGTVWYYREMVRILTPRVPELAGYAQTLLDAVESLTSGQVYGVLADEPGRYRIIASWPEAGVLHIAANVAGLPFPSLDEVDITGPADLLGWLLEERQLTVLNSLSDKCEALGLRPTRAVVLPPELMSEWMNAQRERPDWHRPLVIWSPDDPDEAAGVLGIGAESGLSLLIDDWRELVIDLTAEHFAGKPALRDLLDACDREQIHWEKFRRGLLPALGKGHGEPGKPAHPGEGRVQCGRRCRVGDICSD